jgi:hypothetical protein
MMNALNVQATQVMQTVQIQQGGQGQIQTQEQLAMQLQAQAMQMLAQGQAMPMVVGQAIPVVGQGYEDGNIPMAQAVVCASPFEVQPQVGQPTSTMSMPVVQAAAVQPNPTIPVVQAAVTPPM